MITTRDAICWDGVYANILLYAFFRPSVEIKNIKFSECNVTPLKEFQPFYLEDPGGYLSKSKLYLYEIRLKEYPYNIEEYLYNCFKRVFENDALGAFYMFDGYFLYKNLFSKIDCEAIYGYSTGIESLIELDMDRLKSKLWLEKIKKFKSYLIKINVINK